jgi:hypothetical protein
MYHAGRAEITGCHLDANYYRRDIMNISKALIMAGLLVSTTAIADHKGKDEGKGKPKMHTYAVTITNITHGQSFTPVLVASHTSDVSFFELGEAPSADLADIAEGGATDGLMMTLDMMPEYVMETTTSGITEDGNPLINPGESITVYISGDKNYNRLSLAGMLLPTNDTFVAVNSMPLPKKTSQGLALAYDAGSEMNDELCASIPGPQCGFVGEAFSPGLAEGHVHISRGISGEGDLLASDYDWRNPVAHISISRMD